MTPSLSRRQQGRGGGRKVAKTPGSALIGELEKLVGHRIIVYHGRTSMDRWDMTPLVGLLDAMGHQQKVGVVIQSPGGSADAAHLIANLLREYSDTVHVYVGTSAFSAATIFALSADVLWMGPSSELGPIDPQVPVDLRVLLPSPDPTLFGDVPFEHVPARVIQDFLEWAGVIEDATGQRRTSVSLDRLASVLESRLNPWVLGWYERADRISRRYALDGLTKHLLREVAGAEQLAESIVSSLLENYASHEASVVRTEARDMGIPVRDCPDDVWKKIYAIAEFYQAVLATQGLGRIMETRDGFHATPLRAQRSCPSCGEAFDADPSFAFCPACGHSVGDRCGKCGAQIRSGWKFCPTCGERQPDSVLGGTSGPEVDIQAGATSPAGTASEPEPPS